MGEAQYKAGRLRSHSLALLFNTTFLQELLSLIELDIVAYDMLDLSPLSEYEVYVKKFGSDDTRQVAVQSGEDCLEADSQTDRISSSDVWVQWPPEDLRGYGREEEEESEGCVARVADGQADQNAVRLMLFLKKAGQVRSGCGLGLYPL